MRSAGIIDRRTGIGGIRRPRDTLTKRPPECAETMLESLMIAALIVITMTVFAVRRALRVPRYAPVVNRKSPARCPEPGHTALPINLCHLAQVRHVVDGDTLILATSTQEVWVRLGAVECPENGLYRGGIARLGLLELVGGRRIAFECHGMDGFGRLIATIYVRDIDSDGWTDVNARIIARGHGRVMRRHYPQLPLARRTQLDRLERWAQRNRIGLWQPRDPAPPRRSRAGCA